MNHIRTVMSLSAGFRLGWPIREFQNGQVFEIHVVRQSFEPRGAIELIHFINREPIFKAAIRTSSPKKPIAKNLYLAMEWFIAPTTYDEMRLVNCMTALECLLDSNLNAKDQEVIPKKTFSKLRRKLTEFLTTIEKDSSILPELLEKLPELNRKSFKRKLSILLKQWSVPLHGITAENILSVISKRNKIIHTGDHQDKNSIKDLWLDISVARELLTRIFFMLLTYEGQYASQLGGYHQAMFPPEESAPILSVPPNARQSWISNRITLLWAGLRKYWAVL